VRQNLTKAKKLCKTKEAKSKKPSFRNTTFLTRITVLSCRLKPSGARGQVVGDLNTRLDVDEFETGLMRLASEQFPTDDYLFQEGQYLDGKTVNKWLERKRTSNQLKEEKMKPEDNIGLNPPISDTGTNEQKK
jgi:protein involved in sex pheromone biosynthesis